MKLRWTEQALARLSEIEDFISQDDGAAAAHLVARLIDRAQVLVRFPNSGRTLPELPGTGLRELVEGKYRIVYRLRAGAVEVLTVFEGHQQLPEDALPAEKPPPSRPRRKSRT